MIKSFLFLMMTIFVAVQGEETYAMGDQRVVVVEDVHGTCLSDTACITSVYALVDEFWSGGRRNLRGGASDELERKLTYCPPNCDIVMTPVCIFMGCDRRLADTFLDDSSTPETTSAEPEDEAEFEHNLESTCWGDAGIGTDIALADKVKKALDGQFDLSAIAFRMQVYTCFN